MSTDGVSWQDRHLFFILFLVASLLPFLEWGRVLPKQAREQLLLLTCSRDFGSFWCFLAAPLPTLRCRQSKSQFSTGFAELGRDLFVASLGVSIHVMQ